MGVRSFGITRARRRADTAHPRVGGKAAILRRMETGIPTEQAAADVVRRHLGKEPTRVARFPTGLANYVYDVATADGGNVVARLAPVGHGGRFAGAVYWHGRLAPRGVPLPRLLAHDAAPADATCPFMLIERLPGQDLEFAYPDLSAAQKHALARRIVAIQRAAATLPPGPGFGYALSYADTLHPTWAALLEADLARNLRRIRATTPGSTSAAARVRAKLAAYGPALARVIPRAFLDDTTTKNVLIHDGRLSGIVDVDVVCFGDPLLTPALTQMALLSRGYDTAYIRYWSEELGLRAEQERLLALYTALCCVGFLSELGQRFNKDVAPPVEEETVRRLLGILDELLARC